jgi:hypothetical protein
MFQEQGLGHVFFFPPLSVVFQASLSKIQAFNVHTSYRSGAYTITLNAHR